MPNIGAQELIIVLVIALLIFGPRRLPELGKSMGKGIREFKKATSDLQGHLDVNVEDKPGTKATVLKEKPSGEVVTGEVLREEAEEPVKAAKG